MEESNKLALKFFELRLLRSTLTDYHSLPPPDTPTSSNKWIQSINQIISHIEKGEYTEALNSEATKEILSSVESEPKFQNTKQAAEHFYKHLEARVLGFLNKPSEGSDSWLDFLNDNDHEPEIKSVLIMVLGIASLFVFVQRNITGPCVDFNKFPFSYKEMGCNHDFSEWDSWCFRQIMCDGIDLLGKCFLPQYFVVAKILLFRASSVILEGGLDVGKSISWWVSRLLGVQQKILDEKSATLYGQINMTNEFALKNFGEVSKTSEYWGGVLSREEEADIIAAVNLEAGIKEFVYSRPDSAGKYFKAAEIAAAMKISVTGMLGFRTIHQTDATPQRVLVTEFLEERKDNQGCHSSDEKCEGSENAEKDDNGDVLLAPKIVGVEENGSGDGNVKMLDAMRQAVVLAQCLFVMKNSPDDELRDWDMAPYIEAVDAQKFSHFMVKSCCQILRIRWERKRSRTRERAMQMLDELAREVREGSVGVAERMHFAYSVYFPTVSELLKEYAELLVSLGLVGEALRTFEELELWDNVICCYCLLGKKPAAIDVIKERLKHNPDDPRLWCSLGDVSENDDNYFKALEVSGNRFARAHRSLGKNAYDRGEYKKSLSHWEAALAMNSLHPDGWFALGSAALKARDFDKAIDGFTRAVQLDPDNGEAWNNIACLHMIKDRNKEAFVAFKEALKFRRSSWQMWENFSQVAMNVGNYGQALEAAKMVLDLTKNKRFDVGLLSKMMDEMESLGKTTPESGNEVSENDAISSFGKHQIVEVLGNILQQIVKSGEAGGDIWGLYARWHRFNGNTTSCTEALLKQLRAYQSSDVSRNEELFKKFAQASLQLCEHYIDIATSSDSRKELNTAQMHLRNVVRQGEDFFDLEEFNKLEVCLSKVNGMLDS